MPQPEETVVKEFSATLNRLVLILLPPSFPIKVIAFRTNVVTVERNSQQSALTILSPVVSAP